MFGKKNKGGQGNQNNGVNGQPNMFSSNDFSNFPTQEDFMNSNSNFNFNNENPFMNDMANNSQDFGMPMGDMQNFGMSDNPQFNGQMGNNQGFTPLGTPPKGKKQKQPKVPKQPKQPKQPKAPKQPRAQSGRKSPLLFIILIFIVLLVLGCGIFVITQMRGEEPVVENPPVVETPPVVDTPVVETPPVETPPVEVPPEVIEDPVDVEPTYSYENDILGIKFNYDPDLYIKENVEEIFNTVKSVLPEDRKTFNIFTDKVPDVLNIAKLTTGDSDGLYISISLLSFEIDKETITLKLDGTTEVKNEAIEAFSLADEELINNYDLRIRQTLESSGCEVITFDKTYIDGVGTEMAEGGEEGEKRLKGIFSSRSYSGPVEATTSTGMVDVLQCTIPVGKNAIMITAVTDGRPIEVDKSVIMNEIVNSLVVTTREPEPEVVEGEIVDGEVTEGETTTEN